MRKVKVGDIVVAKKRVGEVRQLLDNGRAFVYFPYVHETDQMVLSGYEQHWNKSDLRVATAAEKKDFRRRVKELKSEGGGMGRRRFELVDPSVNARKFWEIEVNGSEVTTYWGRIGVAPSQKTKAFKSPAAAEAGAEKLVKEKEKKGYRPVSGSAKVPSKKARGKKASRKGKKCAHCGAASKGPTDCPEPWEHSNFKGGCSCAWCKANALLTTSEINWLAKHGWSSAQIKEMNSSPAGRKEARALIKAGRPKKPGAETEKLSGPVDADVQQCRDELLKVGVGFKARNGLLAEICTVLEQIDAKQKSKKSSLDDARRCGALAIKVGSFRADSGHDLLVLPSDGDIMDGVRAALRDVFLARPRSAVGKDAMKLSDDVFDYANPRFWNEPTDY